MVIVDSIKKEKEKTMLPQNVMKFFLFLFSHKSWVNLLHFLSRFFFTFQGMLRGYTGEFHAQNIMVEFS